MAPGAISPPAREPRFIPTSHPRSGPFTSGASTPAPSKPAWRRPSSRGSAWWPKSREPDEPGLEPSARRPPNLGDNGPGGTDRAASAARHPRPRGGPAHGRPLRGDDPGLLRGRGDQGRAPPHRRSRAGLAPDGERHVALVGEPGPQQEVHHDGPAQGGGPGPGPPDRREVRRGAGELPAGDHGEVGPRTRG